MGLPKDEIKVTDSLTGEVYTGYIDDYDLMLRIEELAREAGLRDFLTEPTVPERVISKIESKAEKDEVLKRDGSTPLTEDWDVGNPKILSNTIEARDANGLSLRDKNGGYICIKSGNVGVGTGNPSVPLEVYCPAGNTDKEFLRLRTSGSYTGAGIGIKFVESSSTEVGKIYTMDEGFTARMSFSTYNAPDTLTLKDGKVGIGSTSPSEKLDVNGNAVIRGILDCSSNPSKPKIYKQSSEPSIPVDSLAFWKDTANNKYYMIINFDGVQKKVELT